MKQHAEWYIRSFIQPWLRYTVGIEHSKCRKKDRRGQVKKGSVKLRKLIHILIGIGCMGILPGTEAIVPSSDRDDPEAAMADGDDTLVSPTTNSGNTATGAEFAASSSVQVHETWADSQEALQFPNRTEIPAIEPFSPALATRCSF